MRSMVVHRSVRKRHQQWPRRTGLRAQIEALQALFWQVENPESSRYQKSI